MAELKKISLNGTVYDIADGIIRESIASEYSSSSTYAVGDYCLYNGNVYRCTTAIPSGESWNASHWTEVVVMDEIKSADPSGNYKPKQTPKSDPTSSGTSTAFISSISQDADGVITAAKSGIPFATGSPKAAGTAAVGTANKAAREDHVHPAQTTISGNAGSATKLATARYIAGMAFDGQSDVNYYGECTTDSAVAAKTVSITRGGASTVNASLSLAKGLRVLVRFTKGNTANNITLNVNDKGAKIVKYLGTTPSNILENEVLDLIYDGSDWRVVGTMRGSLDSSVSGLGPGKTITALSETDGVISAAASDIQITTSQITDFADINLSRVYYGVCETPAATSTKVIELSIPFPATAGFMLRVWFKNGNSSSDIKLSVTYTAGTPPISLLSRAVRWHGTSPGTTVLTNIAANSFLDFVYDGTNFNVVDNGYYATSAMVSGTTLVIRSSAATLL